MQKVTISSSLKNRELIKEAISALKTVGVTALFPNLETGVDRKKETAGMVRKLLDEHFAAVSESEAMYVICPAGHIGISTATEMGYAHALGKKIIFSEKPADLVPQALGDLLLPLEEIKKIKKM